MILIATPKLVQKKGMDVRVKRGHHPYFCTLLVATIQYHLRLAPVLFKIFRNERL